MDRGLTQTEVSASRRRASVLDVGAAPTEPGRGRSGVIDAARLAAVIIVVVAHTTGHIFGNGSSWSFAGWLLAVVFHSAVPLLFIISGFLSGSRPDLGASEYIERRVGRLLNVFLFWSVVYLTLNGDPGSDRNRLFRLVLDGNTFFTLWFLWALIVATVVVSLIVRRYGRNWTAALAGATIVAYLCLLAGSGSLGSFGRSLQADEAYWLYASPLLWTGVYALGVVLGGGLRERMQRVGVWCLWAAVPAIVLDLAVRRAGVSFPMRATADTLAYGLAGSGLGLLTCSVRQPQALRLPRWMRDLPLGIYMVHPLILFMVMCRLLPTWDGHGWLSMGLGSVAAVLGSVALALGMSRIPLLRRYV
jgi:surface polysaccharide O-acyltransferase-like enzyme